MHTAPNDSRSAPAAGSLYVFAADLIDEGARAVADRTRELGLSAISLAMAYHQSRDIVPHAGNKPRVRYRQDGVYFEPNPEIWSSSLAQPRVQDIAERNAVAELLALNDRVDVEAWLVILHNSDLGERYPELNGVTCFGDRLLAHLCPSNPDVADYAINLVKEVSAMGMDVIAEALNFQPFPHGHHHERTFTPIGPGEEVLHSLCFCSHCMVAGEKAGISMAALQARVAERIDQAFEGAPALEPTLEALAAAVGDDFLALIELRNQIVLDLTTRVVKAVHANGQKFSYMDLTGSVLSYDHGSPTGLPAADQSWRIGIDVERLSAVSDSITVLGYSSDTERLASDTASYSAIIGDVPLRVILRPGYPDTKSQQHLIEKVAACQSAGTAQIDFYNYGMYTQSVLDRIPEGLKG